jgi:DNA-binding CsgD family transcriptional regulator
MSRAPESASVKADRARAELLTAREREVLQLLAHGHTNREVADRLHISVRTAEWHRASLRRKLDLASRAALVEFAFAHDLAQPGSTIVGRP